MSPNPSREARRSGAEAAGRHTGSDGREAGINQELQIGSSTYMVEPITDEAVVQALYRILKRDTRNRAQKRFTQFDDEQFYHRDGQWYAIKATKE